MDKTLTYSFDDEVSSKFCYDGDNKRIEVYFDGYYDISSSRYIDRPCVWVIEDWSDAKSKVSAEGAYTDLEKHLGIISMVLSSQINDATLEVTIITLDNRYIDLAFIDPRLNLIAS